MIRKFRASMVLLKKGKVVADPKKWFNAAAAWGYEVPIDEETIDAVALGILAVVNWVLTLSTSEKIGM